VRQKDLFSSFLDKFSFLYPQFSFRGLRHLRRTFAPYGLVLRVMFGRGGVALDLFCVALANGHPQEVEVCVAHLHDAEAPGTAGTTVLVAPYFTAEARAACRAAGVGYFDLAGNAGLDTTQVYFEISGKDNPRTRVRQVRHPFVGKAERVARRLLLEPKRCWPLRTLAVASGVSLGLTSMTTAALAKTGALSKERSGLQVLDPGRILDAWRQSYNVRRSVLRVYRSWDEAPALAKRLDTQEMRSGARCALTLWSGAEQALGEPPSATRLAFYWSGQPEELAHLLPLVESGGRTLVLVFQPYDESILWGAAATGGALRVVHPVQLYLDLCSGDEEELRLAQRVRDRLLSW
jgi:hypothetical protein